MLVRFLLTCFLLSGLFMLCAVAESPSDEIIFPDPALAAIVRKEISKPEGPITVGDLSQLRDITVYQSEVRDLSGLEHCPNLTVLNCQSNQIEQLECLAKMPQLERVWVTYNKIKDLTPLRGLTHLSDLALAGNPVEDLSPLAEIASLERLNLGGIPARNFDALKGLTNLKGLLISRMMVTDLGFVSAMVQLESLTASDNEIESLEPLRNLPKLFELNLDGNRISDLSPLSGLKDVWWLDLSNNQISSIEGFPGLRKVAKVELFENQIVDISPLVKACGYTGTIEIELGQNHLSGEAFCRDIPELEARGNVVFFKYESPVEDSTKFIDIKMLCDVASRPDGELVLAAVNRGATAEELQERFGIGADGTQVAQAQADPAPTTEGEIRFPDANLEAVIREHIGKATGPIAREDLLAVTELDATQRGISDLSGLERLPNLNSVNVMSNQIRDLSPLQNLQKLEYLVAADNVITRIEPLTKLPVLRRLEISRNPIVDMDTAKSMTGLSDLDIQSIGLESLDFAAGFKQLLKLDARDNRIRSLEPLRDLRFLIELGLSGNQIEDIGPLAAINNLYRLDLADNRLTSLEGIPRFGRDATIRLFGNGLTEIQPLLNACGYSSTFAIELGENALSADAFCRDIPELLARGVHVVYKYDFPLEKATLFPDVKMLCAAAERSDGALILAAVNHGATQQQLEDRFGPLTAPEPVVVAAAVPAPVAAPAPAENPSAALAVTLADKSFDVSLETSGMDLKSLLGAIVLLGVCVFLVLVWRLPRRL